MKIKVIVENGELEELDMNAEDLEWKIAELIENRYDWLALTVEVVEDED